MRWIGLQIFHNGQRQINVCDFCNTAIWSEPLFVSGNGHLICNRCLEGGLDKRHPEYENPNRIDYDTDWYT